MKLTLVKGHHDINGVSTSSNPSKIIAADGTVLATFIDHEEAELYYASKQTQLSQALYELGQAVYYRLMVFGKETWHLGTVTYVKQALNGSGRRAFLYAVNPSNPSHFALYWENELRRVNSDQNRQSNIPVPPDSGTNLDGSGLSISDDVER